MSPHDIPQWTLGERLRKALSWARMSDDQMAAELGVSEKTIRNYVSGRTTPKLGTLRLWAEATQVPLEWIQPAAGTVIVEERPDDDGGECAPWDLNPEPADCVPAVSRHGIPVLV